MENRQCIICGENCGLHANALFVHGKAICRQCETNIVLLEVFDGPYEGVKEKIKALIK